MSHDWPVFIIVGKLHVPLFIPLYQTTTKGKKEIKLNIL